jgi:rhodanese-related sulfurtransferase
MSTLSGTQVVSAMSASVSPVDAARLVGEGRACIVDVREPDEHRREHVAGAALHPTSSFSVSGFPAALPGRDLLVMCRSGGRAGKVVEAMRAAGRSDVKLLEGGITGWCAAGLPAVRDASAPLPLMRQVMITVGAMLLGLTALAWKVSPWFLAAIGGVAAGLLFAGLTGICALAGLLARMPWNRVKAAPGGGSCAAGGGTCAR